MCMADTKLDIRPTLASFEFEVSDATKESAGTTRLYGSQLDGPVASSYFRALPDSIAPPS